MATGPQASPGANSLRQFQLTGVTDTGTIIGNGSYATVKELEFRGLKCVGKKIHQLLFDAATPQERAAMLQRFTEECELLSRLHSPCVVQFLGIYFEQGSQLPMLVMEYLHTTLSDCLARYGVLPEAISYGILRDVALGLRYLHEHSPPIVHRDLSANNVLLTSSMSGKISDLGVAKILNITPAQMTQRMSTQAPGTPCYMPPEALMARPTYTSKIDSYSYGVMVIHVLCGRWPFPTDVFRHDPRNPGTLIPVSEIDRRAEYLQDISQTHPLMGLIRQCLSNTPAQRPEASEIFRHISGILSRIPATHENKIELESRVQSLTTEKQSMQSQIESLTSQIESLTAQNQDKQSQIESLTAQTQAKHSDIERLRAEVKRLSMRSPKKRSGASSQQPLQSQGNIHVDLQSQPILLHPQAKLHWRKVADMPVGMQRPQVVVVGERVCVGGGKADSDDDHFLVFQYNPARDEWTTLTCCPVCAFGLGHLSGELLTVGGGTQDGTISNKVYHYKPESREWEEFLQPMPTARYHLSVISTQSALITCGGATDFSGGKPVPCTTVEVYTTQTSQWYTCTTDPLPIPCFVMSSTTISNAGYLLGGLTTDDKTTKAALSVPIPSLIQKATSHPQQSASAAQPDSTSSVWKTLQDTPLGKSAAASLGGMLLAIGGHDQGKGVASVHVYSPTTSSWIQVESWDLPEPVSGCSAIELPGNKLLVIGKHKTVFLGSVTIDF